MIEKHLHTKLCLQNNINGQRRFLMQKEGKMSSESSKTFKE